MSEQIQAIKVTPTIVPNAIAPATIENQLAPPFDVSPMYSTSAKALTVTTSVLIPIEIGPGSVTVQQYFDPGNASQIQFYFVYDLTKPGSGQFQEVVFQVTALQSKGITLSQITETLMLMCDSDPKTSRGTTTSVRQTS